jgi:hypothetical protein
VVQVSLSPGLIFLLSGQRLKVKKKEGFFGSGIIDFKPFLL